MSTHGYTRTPRRPGFSSAGSGLHLVPSGADVETGAEDNTLLLGLDGTPAVTSPADTAERCARHADELAGEIEAALRALCAELDGLSDEPSAETRARFARLAWGQGGALRTVGAALGELHTTLDELAHELAAGGRS